MIYFDKVSKIYSPTSIALEDVSFAISPNEFVSIVGQSGAGKSTLVKLLLAEDRPASGKVFFESSDVHAVPPGELPALRRRMGVVFQDYRLLPQKTAYENVFFALEAAGKGDDGLNQRVAIALAIVTRPNVVIADEPTGNLDPLNTWDIIRLLEKINDLGTTVILATHDKEIINSLGRRVVTLEKGKLVRDEQHGRYVI